MNNALRIEQLIHKIGKATITIDNDSKDYLINKVSPYSLPQDYFLKLFNEFKSLIYLQLNENCTQDLLEKFIKETIETSDRLSNIINHRRINYVLDKNNGIISDEAEFTDEYLNKMLKIKARTLELIKKILENELKYFGFHTSEDYKIYKENFDSGNDVLISEKTEKATFNLGKKESIMFIYVLEQSGILKFIDEAHRKQFIENNFNYTEVRENENKGKFFPMPNIASELSVIKAPHQKETNNKTFEKLLNQLTNTLHEFEF